jgi:hypothetical protein
MSEVPAKVQKANPDGYVHARDPNEYQRLRDQALMWQRATEEVLDRIGLKAGMSCLDVGSGPGSVMRLMANRVGPQGQVTGIEIDGNLANQALADLRAQGGANFQTSSPMRSSWRAFRVRPSISPSAAFSSCICKTRWRHWRGCCSGPSLAGRWWRRSSISAPSRSNRVVPL